MSGNTFRSFVQSDQAGCLAVFDANCPDFFLHEEREEYVEFLQGELTGYEVCEIGDQIVGAYGLEPEAEGPPSLCWIMIHPDAKGAGIGKAMMHRCADKARELGADAVRMGASHLSAPFFAKFGAVEKHYVENGWGPGMHRIDMVWPLDGLAGQE